VASVGLATCATGKVNLMTDYLDLRLLSRTHLILRPRNG